MIGETNKSCVTFYDVKGNAKLFEICVDADALTTNAVNHEG